MMFVGLNGSFGQISLMHVGGHQLELYLFVAQISLDSEVSFIIEADVLGSESVRA
jgi:hypothetical protein